MPRIEFKCRTCGQVLYAPATAGGKEATCPACASHMTVPSKGPTTAAKGVRAPKDELAQAMDILERAIPGDSLAPCPWGELAKIPEAASQAVLNIFTAFASAKHPHCGNFEGKVNFNGIQCLLMLVSQFKLASASHILHAIRAAIRSTGLGSRVYEFKDLDERCDNALKELPATGAHSPEMARKALEYSERLERKREQAIGQAHSFWMRVSSEMDWSTFKGETSRSAGPVRQAKANPQQLWEEARALGADKKTAARAIQLYTELLSMVDEFNTEFSVCLILRNRAINYRASENYQAAIDDLHWEMQIAIRDRDEMRIQDCYKTIKDTYQLSVLGKMSFGESLEYAQRKMRITAALFGDDWKRLGII